MVNLNNALKEINNNAHQLGLVVHFVDFTEGDYGFELTSLNKPTKPIALFCDGKTTITDFGHPFADGFFADVYERGLFQNLLWCVEELSTFAIEE